ncbi:MAG: hypothetical protein KDD51_14640 [Bdellovibrionales bacterium]|nr:hypothetical protein [Bdellovibrionales bacterium]
MKKIGIFLMCAVCGAPAFGATFFVESAGNSHVPDSDAASVTQLVKASVGELGHDVVLERSAADFVLLPKLIPLGSAYIVNLEKWKGNKRLYSNKMKSAQLENMDEVVKRLTRAVISEVRTSEDVRVGEVTEQESDEGQRRRPARQVRYFALGPAGFGNLSANSVGVYVAGAYAFDVNQAIIRIRGEGAFGGGALFADFGLGASYFFSLEDTAPFVGLDFGYGVSRVNNGTLFGDTVTGFVLAPIIGVQFMRTSSVNLEVAGRAAFLLSRNSIGNPMLFVIRVGLYF